MTNANVPPVPPQPTPAAAGPKQTLSLTSFITGLASVVFSWIPVLGFLAALAAIIIGFMGKSKEPGAPKWMWMVGIIAGFVGVLLGIVFIFTVIVLPLMFVASIPSIAY